MADVAEAVAGPGAPSLPMAPAEVQNWLRPEDWEALQKAWQDAESQVIAWAEGSDTEDARMEELWQEASMSRSMHSTSMQSLPPLSQTRSTMRRTKSSTKGGKKWDEDFHLIGSDARKPAPLRRYFDGVPSENSLPVSHRRGQPDPRKKDPRAVMDPPENLKTRRYWAESHHQTVSPDNEALHPHLRSYFDRRGLESCYRQRPTIDATDKRKMRPRTPQRPTTRDKIMRFTKSEPSLKEPEDVGTQNRHLGGVHWGKRCQMYNSCSFKFKPEKKTLMEGIPEKIDWVTDHHVSVTSDNTELHPALRHYFDADGIESSFTNRGMHYGRPDKRLAALGITLADINAEAEKNRRNSVESSSSGGWDSIHSSLLDKLSYTSLQESNTPGGLPVVRPRAPDSPSRP